MKAKNRRKESPHKEIVPDYGTRGQPEIVGISLERGIVAFTDGGSYRAGGDGGGRTYQCDGSGDH